MLFQKRMRRSRPLKLLVSFLFFQLFLFLSLFLLFSEILTADGMDNLQGTPKRVSGSMTPPSPIMTPTTAQANQLLDMDRAFTELENFQQVNKFSFSVGLLVY
jgi:hypothetical protein